MFAADVNVIPPKGNAAAVLAANKGQFEGSQMLFDAGTNISATGDFGDSVLTRAVFHDHTSYVTYSLGAKILPRC